MTINFDVDFITFRCTHAKCREIFEKSLKDIVSGNKIFCPRCGTAADFGEENHLLAAARASAGARMEKTAR